MTQIIQKGNRWRVSGAMTMPQIKTLLAESSVLSITAETEIDLVDVSEVETVTISLLFEWLRQASTRKCKLTFVNLPQNLTSLATLYGVLDFIPQSSH